MARLAACPKQAYFCDMTRSTPQKPATVGSTPDRTALQSGYLTGQLLIAMPQMSDECFQKSVLYIFAHSEDGAMGLVINKVLDSLTLPDLMHHLEVPAKTQLKPDKIHFGGPVDTARGFVLHSVDYSDEGTRIVGEGLALTATLDILRAIGRGEGPRHTLLALGYANWGPGQLDAELQANAWLSAPADETLVFDIQNDTKWQRAIGQLGIDAGMLSSEAGHA
jgi:putative transcriptional regulator